MKTFFPYCFLLLFSTMFSLRATAQEIPDSVSDTRSYIDSISIMDPFDLFLSLPTKEINNKVVNRSFIPKVFGGYRKIHKIPEFKHIKPYNGLQTMTPLPTDSVNQDLLSEDLWEPEVNDSIDIVDYIALMDTIQEINDTYTHFIPGKRPKWLNDALLAQRIQEDLMYSYMIDHPEMIEYADWELPEPPVLYEDDITFLSFIKKQESPDMSEQEAVLPEFYLKKIHWLHTFGTLLQFSQAFVSPNWYQGGNNYLALLFNFNWNVNLNQVFHPKLLFQSALSYKMALSSTPKGSLHKYTISDDAFQYNLNAGLKAFGNWYYSYNLLFKTQLLNNYEESSMTRTASFLSPGDLNMGIGMSYNHKNKLNTFQYTLTISPLSYNLKTCISDKIDHSIYNIAPDKKVKNEIGSNAEINLQWQLMSNISYKTRFFIFTDYSYFLGDWQNTFSFDINRFLSTQLFIHLRWDTSAEKTTNWKTFMMREILSFGLSYTFSTKP